MTDEVLLTAALDEYRQMLQVDGADMELTGVRDGVVALRLTFGPETCQDCVLSKDMLESVLLPALQRTDDRISALAIDDPRDA